MNIKGQNLTYLIVKKKKGNSGYSDYGSENSGYGISYLPADVTTQTWEFLVPKYGFVDRFHRLQSSPVQKSAVP